MLFVPAGVPHRFASFSAEFKAWVLFFGPEGRAEINRRAGNKPAPGPVMTVGTG